MKILYYTNQIAAPGGLERVLTEKANAWVQKGYNVRILTFVQKGASPFYTLDKRVALEDLRIPYKTSKPSFSPINLFLLPLHLFRLFLYIKRLSPDVIVVANCKLESLFFPFISHKAKVIKEEHLSRFRSEAEKKASTGIRRMYEWINKKALSYYSKIVVLNQDELNYEPTSNCIVIPNPIDTTKVFNISSDRREKIILSVGRVTAVKQFDHLIEIFEAVHKKFPDWKLRIIGSGKQLPLIKERVKALGLEKIVDLPGDSNKVYSEMQSASIFALTSKSESFGMVLLEAMLNGLPVISYDSPYGPRHIIKNGEDGYLIPYQDKNKYIRRLSLMMEDIELRKAMSEHGIINVLRFDISKVMMMWDSLFHELGIKQTDKNESCVEKVSVDV